MKNILKGFVLCVLLLSSFGANAQYRIVPYVSARILTVYICYDESEKKYKGCGVVEYLKGSNKNKKYCYDAYRRKQISCDRVTKEVEI